MKIIKMYILYLYNILHTIYIIILFKKEQHLYLNKNK